MKKYLTQIRIVFITLAIAFVLIPLVIVSFTGKGFGSLTADILISFSILSAICAIMIGINKANKSKFYFRIGSSLGLLIVLFSLWI